MHGIIKLKPQFTSIYVKKLYIMLSCSDTMYISLSGTHRPECQDAPPHEQYIKCKVMVTNKFE